MIKRLLTILSFLCAQFNYTNAQENNAYKELGIHFDINGIPINNYCDFDYLPKNSLKIYFETAGKYVPGAYYDVNGKKYNGEIKQSKDNTDVYFRNSDQGMLLSPNDCVGYVTGLDSFTVISNFQVSKAFGKSVITERSWAEVITKAKAYTLLKHTRQRDIGTDFIETYIVKTDTSSLLTSIFDNNTVIKLFGDFQAIKDAINDMKLSYPKIETITKHYQYKDKYEKNEKIYYSSSWDELKGSAGASYYANITGLNGLVWELKFFTIDNIPVYVGHFSSFSPIIKHGEFTWFYPNGTIRKRVSYKDDEITGTIVEYFKNGNIHYEYKVKGNNYKYIRVTDTDGKDLLNTKGSGSEKIYDSINNREITRCYSSNEFLHSAYYDTNKSLFFQYCGDNTSINSFKNFQGRLEGYVKYPVEGFKNYRQGLVLIRFLVDSSGNTISYNIVKGLGDEFDKQILSFLGSNNCKLRWSIPLYRNKPSFQEILVPVFFGIKAVERAGVSYYNMYNSSYWMWQWQNQNQIRIQQDIINSQRQMIRPSYNFR